MKKVAQLLSLVAAGLAVSCTSFCPKSNPRAVELFNGRDLSNWTSVLAKPEVKKEAVWSVRNGHIVCLGEPLGYIYTDKSFTNFKLLVEWRWAPGKAPGNSGIFLRINGEPRPLPRCIEHQLKSGDAGDFYGFHGLKIAGPSDRFLTITNHALGGDLCGVKKLFGNEKSAGRWNMAEIMVDGPTVTTWINGRRVNQATRCAVVAGPVGLQSEGGEIHFRTVRIIPLEK